MNKITNKVICLLLTLVMLLGVLPLAGLGTFSAKAAEAPTWGEAGKEKTHEDRMKKLITTLNPVDRTKVNKVEGTSDTATIPVYGGAYKKPTVTVTTGEPARFNINSGNGDWFKKNSAGVWERYNEPTFTEGTYMFHCQVRIDDAAGLTHMLDSAGVTVTVDGVAWTTGTPGVYDDYSLVWADSPEYTVTAPAGTPLAFMKSSAWDIENPKNGVAITSFSVASGATGGTAPYTFSKVSGPAWLQVAPDGTVSGTAHRRLQEQMKPS